MTLAFAVFAFSLLAIAGLFALKYVEVRRGTRFAPVMRERADSGAVRLKGLIFGSRTVFEKLLPEMMHVARLVVREIALTLAALARAIERGAYALADMVSHKHRFERREPKNEFLKRVEEVKNGTNGGTDTRAV